MEWWCGIYLFLFLRANTIIRHTHTHTPFKITHLHTHPVHHLHGCIVNNISRFDAAILLHNQQGCPHSTWAEELLLHTLSAHHGPRDEWRGTRWRRLRRKRTWKSAFNCSVLFPTLTHTHTDSEGNASTMQPWNAIWIHVFLPFSTQPTSSAQLQQFSTRHCFFTNAHNKRTHSLLPLAER